MADGRRMVRKIEDNEVQKAKAMVEAYLVRQEKARKKMASEAAKKARKWLTEGRLKPLYVVTADWARYYKREPNIVPKGGPD